MKYKLKDIAGRALSSVLLVLLFAGVGVGLLSSCARMGAPDGGWYDETPPHVVSASPEEHGVNAKSKRITINFSEFIKLENAQEKVVISPPQMEQPDIKTHGKNIVITLQDTLKENTTYTVDFSDAISDNNEGNPMGNYTYTFSTGPAIDTMEVSGYVINAENHEPIKGIMVGLHPANSSLPKEGTEGATPGPVLSNSAAELLTTPFLRVSRTDSRGYFVIRGIAPGSYTVGAVQDMDGDYRFSQRAEMMAFSHDVITPSFFPDHRQDTLWLDELHIKDIHRQPYTHFMPDNIVLRAFAHKLTDRYYLKAERQQADRFTLFFTAPLFPDSLAAYQAHSALPTLTGLNFNSDDAFIVEPSQFGDTITYWLRDTALVNQDTLRLAMTTLITDTLGTLQLQSDTLEILAKTPYAKRLKQQANEYKEWHSALEKRLKHAQEGEVIDTIMPPKRLEPKYDSPQAIAPDQVLSIAFPSPMQRIDTAAVHLYVEQDSLWYKVPFTMTPVPLPGAALTNPLPQEGSEGTTPCSILSSSAAEPLSLPRTWELYSEWIPGAQYSLEIDTLAFEDIYGLTTVPYKTGFKVQSLDTYGSLFVNVTYSDTAQVIVRLLDKSDKVVRTAPVENGTAEFYYLQSGTYYLSAFADVNGNGVWDTGDYYVDRQPEPVFYYHEAIECKAKWDITKTWDLTARPLNMQKPGDLVKQKGDKKKTVRNRNAERAKQKGIQLPSNL